jgi:hypothetical protein
MPVTILRPGAVKSQPFTIVVVANPVLEAPLDSGQFIVDPVISRRLDFDAAARDIEASLFDTVPGQLEQLLGEPTIAPEVRFIELFETGLPAQAVNCLVAQDHSSYLLVPKPAAALAFIRTYAAGEEVDVVFAVSGSRTHDRASTYLTQDDPQSGGVPFALDGRSLVHHFLSREPGTAAIHVDPANHDSLTPLHEFQHAISSYQNGRVIDLYVDNTAATVAAGSPSVNCKVGRPIPAAFSTLDGAAHASDSTRNGIGYPPAWRSYHCELFDASRPAAMDDYYQGVPDIACQNDTITRQFVMDRVHAKLLR